MKNTIICFFLLLLSFVDAQTKIAGSYHVSSGNPDDGGYNWVLMENHEFAMFTFGQIIAGKWEIDKQNRITFSPNSPKYPFDVYGRYNSKVKGTKVMFSNFDINEDAFIGNSEAGIQPVLSQNANCLPYPLVNEFKEKFKDIILSTYLYREEKESFYKADFQKYNDFMIIYYSSSRRVPPFKAMLKDEKLYFNNNEKASSERKDLNPDELAEMGMYVSQGAAGVTKETIVANKVYNVISYGIGESTEKFDEESFLKFNYNYDPSTEIYTAKNKYKAAKGDDFHDLNILYQYHKVELSPSEKLYEKSDKSIFNITCKN
jgi:hypothetical protein